MEDRCGSAHELLCVHIFYVVLGLMYICIYFNSNDFNIRREMHTQRAQTSFYIKFL